MTITPTIDRVSRNGGVLDVYGRLVFTNNYVNNGDTLSFAGQPSLPTRSKPLSCRITGRAGGFMYMFKPGTDMTNGLVEVHVNDAGGANAQMGQHTVAAYVAGITGDTVDFHAVFPLFE